jgi:long-chain acyl-CoA synthetase
MDSTLVHLLLESVQHYPDSDAVVSQGRRMTYATLWKDICATTEYLLQHGLKPGDRVGILVENSPEYIAIYYAVLAAGGIAVGLNTASKAKELSNWLSHCSANWLFASTTHPDLAHLQKLLGKINIIGIGEQNNNIISFQRHWSEVKNFSDKEPHLTRLSDNSKPAAIIYTSGTTGNPKGVTLSHKNLYSNIQSILAYLNLEHTDSIVTVLPFYYSYGNSVLHTHLAVGGKLVLVNSMLYPQQVLEMIEQEKATGFSGVPSTFALLLHRTKLHNYNLSSIRYMTQAGGPMAPASISRLLAEIPDIKFFVMYGQTEASARLSYLPPEKLKEKMGSVGIAIPGVTLEIRKEDGTIAKTGETGEIYATGDNIMLGYWNSPDLTNNAIKNGWLKTGDLARYDDDMYIYIVGRSSEMIKTGANRISPKEVEEVIHHIEGVEEVAVIGVEDEILGQVIKAFVVPSATTKLDKKTILAHCKKELANYKIPKYIEYIDELPKTASGKIKRYQLH